MKAISVSRTRNPGSSILMAILVLATCLAISPEPATAEASESASIIRATPYFVGGKQRGYRLFPISDPAPYEAMGLQPGDLLLEVDGKPMVEPRAHLDLFERLDSGISVVVKILRSDEVVEITVQLQ